MLKKLKELLQGVVTKSSRQSQIERFIISKNPSTVAEVEYWARFFDRNGGRYGY